jgi:hypothetical protein
VQTVPVLSENTTTRTLTHLTPATISHSNSWSIFVKAHLTASLTLSLFHSFHCHANHIITGYYSTTSIRCDVLAMSFQNI